MNMYGYALVAVGADESHWHKASMYGWTYASYNLALAGLLSFLSDWYRTGRASST